MEDTSDITKLARAGIRVPWAAVGRRCCGRPPSVTQVEPAPPGYWVDESTRDRCVLECRTCGKRYLGWYE